MAHSEGRHLNQRYLIIQSRLLGKGSTGNVYLGIDTHSQQQKVAIKAIDLREINNEVTRYLLSCQIAALSSMGKRQGQGHPNVVQLYDIIIEKQYIFLVMQLFQGGTLTQLIKQHPMGVGQDRALNIFKQIINGYAFIRLKNIIHRDLKPDNILFKSNDQCLPALIDFGYCQADQVQPKPQVYYNVGSPKYMAPQAYKQNNYSQKSDIWALGVVLYQLLLGRTCDYGLNMEQYLDLLQKKGVPVPNTLRPLCRNLLIGMLTYRPQQRWNINQIIQTLVGPTLRKNHQCSERILKKFNQEQLRMTLQPNTLQKPRDSLMFKSMIVNCQTDRQYPLKNYNKSIKQQDRMSCSQKPQKKSIFTYWPKTNIKSQGIIGQKRQHNYFQLINNPKTQNYQLQRNQTIPYRIQPVQLNMKLNTIPTQQNNRPVSSHELFKPSIPYHLSPNVNLQHKIQNVPSFLTKQNIINQQNHPKTNGPQHKIHFKFVQQSNNPPYFNFSHVHPTFINQNYHQLLHSKNNQLHPVPSKDSQHINNQPIIRTNNQHFNNFQNNINQNNSFNIHIQNNQFRPNQHQQINILRNDHQPVRNDHHQPIRNDHQQLIRNDHQQLIRNDHQPIRNGHQQFIRNDNQVFINEHNFVKNEQYLRANQKLSQTGAYNGIDKITNYQQNSIINELSSKQVPFHNMLMTNVNIIHSAPNEAIKNNIYFPNVNSLINQADNKYKSPSKQQTHNQIAKLQDQISPHQIVKLQEQVSPERRMIISLKPGINLENRVATSKNNQNMFRNSVKYNPPIMLRNI